MRIRLLLSLAALLSLAPDAAACPNGSDPACGLVCGDVLAGNAWADDLGAWPAVCGSPEYSTLLACAESSCSDTSTASGPCGAIPDPLYVADVLTQWNTCDAEGCTPPGIPAACLSCLASSCGVALDACSAAGCAP